MFQTHPKQPMGCLSQKPSIIQNLQVFRIPSVYPVIWKGLKAQLPQGLQVPKSDLEGSRVPSEQLGLKVCEKPSFQSGKKCLDFKTNCLGKNIQKDTMQYISYTMFQFSFFYIILEMYVLVYILYIIVGGQYWKICSKQLWPGRCYGANCLYKRTELGGKKRQPMRNSGWNHPEKSAPKKRCQLFWGQTYQIRYLLKDANTNLSKQTTFQRHHVFCFWAMIVSTKNFSDPINFRVMKVEASNSLRSQPKGRGINSVKTWRVSPMGVVEFVTR